MKLALLLKQYALTKWNKRRWKSRDDLETWQNARVRAFLEETRRKSRFYARLHDGLPLENWREWPAIDKAAMMDGFDELNTAGITKDEALHAALQAERERDFTPELNGVTVGLSSGTSGSRGLFIVSAGERAAWAGAALAKALPGSLLRKHRIAFFLRADSNLYQTVKSRRIRFSFFDMIRPVREHIERLGRLQPTLLIAPPSMLRLLAEAKGRGELTIEPDKIISVAEVLEPIDRQVIEHAFGKGLHQIYQCTEGFLGATCEHGTLHLNEDIAVIQREYVDAERRTFMPVITDFSRTSQPIIRYRLNDLLTLRAEPCPCGSVFTAVESVSGRADDLFFGRCTDGGGDVPLFPDFIRRAVMMASDEITEYKVVQLGPESLQVSVRTKEGAPDVTGALRRELTGIFAQHGCRPPEITFTPYSFQPGLTKLRRIERAFSVETDGGTDGERNVRR
ncbi:F390 synthetase-related protein [Paenibacillus sp. 1P03SA]|uniref:F390 synthetase-related protein n=1 Tax=Paenibacillus sp. 1P03SA TaxID=3132294 RepID=UPI0039A28EC6